MTDLERLATAIENVGISPNVPDSNLEAANVVDALDDLAKAGTDIARGLQAVASAIRESNGKGSKNAGRGLQGAVYDPDAPEPTF